MAGESFPEKPATLLLASASPRRRELLAALHVPFTVRPLDVEEHVEEGLPSADVVTNIAAAKASASLTLGPNDGVLHLAADTVVVLGSQVLGKPPDAAAARQMLLDLAGRSHDVYTAVVLAGGGVWRSRVERTAVLMRPYTTAEIEASIAAGTPFDKAGAYAIQDPLLRPVQRYDGCYCNVMGLPLWTVYALLCELAPELKPATPAAAFARCVTCSLAQ